MITAGFCFQITFRYRRDSFFDIRSIGSRQNRETFDRNLSMAIAFASGSNAASFIGRLIVWMLLCPIILLMGCGEQSCFHCKVNLAQRTG